MNPEEIMRTVDIQDGFLFAMFTDKVVVDRYPLNGKMKEYFNESIGTLLDLRVFDAEKEYRFFRGSIGKSFTFRKIDDSKEYIERVQLFDIDRAKSRSSFANNGTVKTIGGGAYHLPLPRMEDARIILHEYLQYDECGNARVYDWRLADFRNGGK